MKAFVILAAAAALAAPAGANAAGSCFRTNDIRNHVIAPDNGIYLRVNTKDVYRLDTTGSCLAGHFRTDPLIIDPSPVTGMVCSPVDLTLKIGDSGNHGFSTPCIVSGMRKLTPTEIAALPKKQRP